jgi:hypothetical protein
MGCTKVQFMIFAIRFFQIQFLFLCQLKFYLKSNATSRGSVGIGGFRGEYLKDTYFICVSVLLAKWHLP